MQIYTRKQILKLVWKLWWQLYWELITAQTKDFCKLQIYSSLEMMRLTTPVVKILLLL